MKRISRTAIHKMQCNTGPSRSSLFNQRFWQSDFSDENGSSLRMYWIRLIHWPNEFAKTLLLLLNAWWFLKCIYYFDSPIIRTFICRSVFFFTDQTLHNIFRFRPKWSYKSKPNYIHVYIASSSSFSTVNGDYRQEMKIKQNEKMAPTCNLAALASSNCKLNVYFDTVVQSS